MMTKRQRKSINRIKVRSIAKRKYEGFRAYKIREQIIFQLEMKSGKKRERKPLKNIYTFMTALVNENHILTYIHISKARVMMMTMK
jgi:hypothetical protein